MVAFGVDLKVQRGFWLSEWQRKDGTGKMHGSENKHDFKGIESKPLKQLSMKLMNRHAEAMKSLELDFSK